MTPAERYGLRRAQQQPPVRDLVLTAFAVLAIVIFWTVTAQARWKPEYASASPEERAWYDRQTTTAETRKRIGAAWYLSCCDDGDTVDADFKKSDGHWHYRRKGEMEWHRVPDDAVQADVQTPHGSMRRICTRARCASSRAGRGLKKKPFSQSMPVEPATPVAGFFIPVLPSFAWFYS